MKRVKNISLIVLVVLSFTACNNEEVIDKGNPSEVLAGKETYVSFNFQVEGNKTNTRGAMISGEAAASEDKVSEVRILIFDETSGTLLNNEKFTAASTEDTRFTVKTTSGNRRIYIITGADGKVQMTAKLNALRIAEPTSTIADFYALMTDEKYDTDADTDMGDGFKELPTANSFVMSNVADISAVKILQPNVSKEQSANGSGEDANVNRFEFNVLRAVAKGDLKVELKQSTLTTADGVFKLKEDVTYGVRNVNRGTLYVQQFINDKQTARVNDHSAETGLRPFAAFYNVFDGKGAEELKLPATYRPYYFGGYDIKGANAVKTEMKASNGGAATAGTSVYFSENSNNIQLRGNTTYYGITIQVASITKDNIAGSVTFDTDLSKITTGVATTDYDNTAGTASFWCIRKIPAKIEAMLAPPVRCVFTNEAVAFKALTIILKNTPVALTTEGFTDGTYTATALKAAYDEAVSPAGSGNPMPLNAADLATVKQYLGYYKNGFSFYRLNLYELTDDGNRRHLVRRNHNYQATVTSFATIGDPTEPDLDKDLDKPVDADVTNVTAIIKVVGWHDIPMKDDL